MWFLLCHSSFLLVCTTVNTFFFLSSSWMRTAVRKWRQQRISIRHGGSILYCLMSLLLKDYLSFDSTHISLSAFFNGFWNFKVMLFCLTMLRAINCLNSKCFICLSFLNARVFLQNWYQKISLVYSFSEAYCCCDSHLTWGLKIDQSPSFENLTGTVSLETLASVSHLNNCEDRYWS